MAAQPVSTVPVDGGRIGYRRLGHGPALLVLNGLAATNADWDPGFLEGLAAANELVVLDNRGIGASADDGRAFDVAALARDTTQVVEALELGPTSVLGWSMGGFIAQLVALDRPELVERLVLMSTDPGGPAATLADPTIRAQLVDTSGTPAEQARRLLELLFPRDLADAFYEEFGDLVAEARAALPPELVARQAAAMDGWHRDGVGARVDGLGVPTLVLTGSEDIVIPPANALTLAQAIPGARLTEFADGGHAFMAQYPRAAANVINEFLAL
jgi:pimeloyl-ACP methyl ester carboxylesterase